MLRPFLTLLAFAVSLTAAEVTVSPGESLTVARDALRAKRKAGDTSAAVIILKAGTHEIKEPLVLDPQDSGLSIRSEGGATVLCVGSVQVTGFSKHEGQIFKADVSGIAKRGVKYRQVLWGGERLTLARYPNADAKDPLYGGWAFVQPFPPAGAPQGHDWKKMLYVKKQDIRKWTHPEDVELDIFAQYGWWNFILPVQSLDAENGLLTLAKPCSYDLHPHNRYHFQNALEELDAPGEWFLDPRTLTLYVWPPDAAQAPEGKVRLVTLESFIQIRAGTKNVSVERLSFTGCTGHAVSLNGTEDCRVAGCTFDTVGDFNGTAVSVNGGKNNVVLSNEISRTGGNGVNLGGGDRITLTACNNRAENNHIHHIGIFNKNACGVSAYGAGIVVAHNHIHDGPRMGVQMGGNLITVEYNHLHHLCLETQDGGAVYTGGRDWLGGRGNIWRYNRIHDVVGCGQEPDGLKVPWFTFGLYPDDNTGGVDIIGNLVYRVAYTPIHLHNSRDCIVENNVFAFGQRFQFDLHGWKKGDRFYENHIGTMIKGYESVAGQPVWKEMRGMDLHPKDALREDGTMMSGNVVRRNIMLSNTPGVKYGDLRNVSPKWNTIDENVAWNGGHPVTTGLNRTGKDVGPALQTENFDVTPDGKLPPGWGFNHKPNAAVQLRVEGGSLKADCAIGADPKNPKTVFHGPDFVIEPGGAYRIRLRVKSTEPTAQVSVAVAMFKAGGGYWQGKSTTYKVQPEWMELEAVATLPAKDSPAWKPWMTAAWLRVDCLDAKGSVLVDDVRIFHAEPLDEWASWQAEGWDQHSIVADPMFVDAANDDFRLKPASPALKLGFKELPIEKMGILSDEWRKP